MADAIAARERLEQGNPQGLGEIRRPFRLGHPSRWIAGREQLIVGLIGHFFGPRVAVVGAVVRASRWAALLGAELLFGPEPVLFGSAFGASFPLP